MTTGPTRLTRRDLLGRCANGFGIVALRSLLGDRGFAGTGDDLPVRPAHYPAKARSVIFLYMDGGVSQVDSFDPKPRLTKEDGRPFGMKKEPTQFNDAGNTFGSPWKFRRYGESGIPVSDLFPHIGRCADELAVVRSMVADFPEHTTANYFLHTGIGRQGRPSLGAWISYGLGSLNQNLPGFVVLDGGLIPPGGLDNFQSGFLPASHQGSVFKPQTDAVANIVPREKTRGLQNDKLALVDALDRAHLDATGSTDALESAIVNYELAYRMQTAVPELMDLEGESEATKRLYGFDSDFEYTQSYARQCLLARRLVERGVRFVELTCPKLPGNDRWDQHGNLRKGHAENARAVDQPIAGLLRDLKSRGLLDETLVVFAGEFGRTPFAQGRDGRDHNQYAFSIWLAGAGIRGGTVYGTTDEYGYKVVDNEVTIHDLHATILHLLGVDHERQTFRFSGRDMRLTDVFGTRIAGILA